MLQVCWRLKEAHELDPVGRIPVNTYPKVKVDSLNLGLHVLTTILLPLQSCDSRSSVITTVRIINTTTEMQTDKNLMACGCCALLL